MAFFCMYINKSVNSSDNFSQETQVPNVWSLLWFKFKSPYMSNVFHCGLCTLSTALSVSLSLKEGCQL